MSRGFKRFLIVLLLWFPGVFSALTMLIELLSGNLKGAATPLVIAIVFLGAAYWCWRRTSAAAGALKEGSPAVQRAVAFFDQVQAAGEFPPVATRMMLQRDEEALLAAQVNIYETRKVYKAGHAGPRIKVGGMPLYIGRTQGTSSNDMTHVDSGELVLTGKRLIFAGAERTLAFDLSELVNVEANEKILLINMANRQRPFIAKMTDDPTWAVTIKVAARTTLNGRKVAEGETLRVT
jgi:hypothetical protein